MSELHMTATQMMWRPKLIKLTQSAQPELDNGAKTMAFVNPECITRINRLVIGWTKRDGTGQWPDQCVTAVSLHGSEVIFCEETPEQIARLRDEAFGHGNEKAATLRPVK